ncbi:DUF3301 domain-containing protein [Dokdonella sp.]|uniref:DUF3301 domain-containing protein n=1 Tax=Dokdonella sp. TaxID=2291710 RepID=UPI0031C9EE43|nr:DUF3301 domain-containing protein [Dokdonella sp.]
MTGTWIALLLVASLVWAWLDALRAREQAIRHGRALCREAGVQLLDQTVSLHRLRVARRDGLPALVRRYAFEVSLDGSDRHRGHLDLGGHRLEAWSLPLPADAALAAEPAAPARLTRHG